MYQRVKWGRIPDTVKRRVTPLNVFLIEQNKIRSGAQSDKADDLLLMTITRRKLHASRKKEIEMKEIRTKIG